jgi:hypothetical protein
VRETIEQASAAEEATTYMEQMGVNIRQNDDNALQTKRSPSKRLRMPRKPSMMWDILWERFKRDPAQLSYTAKMLSQSRVVEMASLSVLFSTTENRTVRKETNEMVNLNDTN